MRCMDDTARRDNAAVLLTITDALLENRLLNEGEGDEGDEEGGPDVHRGRIRDVDAVDVVVDGANKNDDDEDDELQRLADDDARRRIVPVWGELRIIFAGEEAKKKTKKTEDGSKHAIVQRAVGPPRCLCGEANHCMAYHRLQVVASAYHDTDSS